MTLTRRRCREERLGSGVIGRESVATAPEKDVEEAEDCSEKAAAAAAAAAELAGRRSAQEEEVVIGRRWA